MTPQQHAVLELLRRDGYAVAVLEANTMDDLQRASIEQSMLAAGRARIGLICSSTAPEPCRVYPLHPGEH